MTITKASELFAKDGRFFPTETTDEELNRMIFAPFPADQVEEEEQHAALVETEGPLGEWWIAVERRPKTGSLSGSPP